MVQKPMQNIITVVLFVTAILVLAMTSVMTVRAPEESGIVLSGRYNGCEVIYQQASQRSKYAIIASETGEEDMPALYHAVYTCACPPVVALISA